jgi:hypothetical protein
MTEFTGDVGGAGHRALTSEQVIADDADLRAGRAGGPGRGQSGIA